jgi:predicted PhzF superfamily epimerase YddE/YHI9
VLPEVRGLSDADMLRIAAEVGFSETAFLIRTADNTYDVRYVSPRIEVPSAATPRSPAVWRGSSWAS